MYEHLVVQRCSWKLLLHVPFSSIQIFKVHNMGGVVQRLTYLVSLQFEKHENELYTPDNSLKRKGKKKKNYSVWPWQISRSCALSQFIGMHVTQSRGEKKNLIDHLIGTHAKNYGAAWPEYQFGHGINRLTLLIFWLVYCISTCILSLATYTGCFW